MNLQELKEKYPDKDPIFSAISYLKTVEEIKQFQIDYRKEMVDAGYTEKDADDGIGYVFGYGFEEDKELVALWKSAMTVTHPLDRKAIRY